MQTNCHSILLRLFAACVLFFPSIAKGQCGPTTPSFTVNLVGNPGGTYTSPNTVRADTCCGGLIAGNCVKFTILLDPGAMGINFGFASGAVPPGALFYQIGCDSTVYPVGTPVCLNGAGPHILTFCKPGGNANTYSIASIPAPNLPDSVLVRSGCQQTLSINGLSVPTITWTSVPSNTLYNSYLSCQTNCSVTIVTPTGTFLPPFVDYMVSGYGLSPCQSNFYRDTVRVYFYNDLAAPISPTTICFGSISAVLNPTPTGGLAPFTYTWSTGSNASSITVGQGTYALTLGDATGCPPVISTVAVGIFTLPIAANAGPDHLQCNTNINIPLSGTITSASGGTWSAGGGTFVPHTAQLSATYIPTSSEVSAGFVQFILGTTGNSGCPPDEDTLIVTFQNQPTITASSNQTICANNNISIHSANIAGYTATAVWSAASGTFTPPSGVLTSFYPSSAQISAGVATLIASTANNGACGVDSDTILVFITPSPTVNAAADQTICSSAAAALAGSVAPSPFTGSWTTTGDGTFSNAAALNSGYTPGPGDILAGSAQLVLVSTNIGNCNVVRDTMLLTIVRSPTVSVSVPNVICSSDLSAAVNATIAGSTGTGSWTTSGSGSFASTTSLQTSYALSAGDAGSTFISFTITSTNNGPCPAVSANATMSVAPNPTVFAGFSQAICTSQSTIALAAVQPTVIGTTSTGVWSSGGSGTFAGTGSYQTTTYSLSAGDIAAGSVIFTLTSTFNGVCPARSDTIRIGIVNTPTVLAGSNQPVCASGGTIGLQGLVAGGVNNSGVWSASGSGTFNPGNTALMTQYQISPSDIVSGFVIFTLTSTNNGPCAAVTDSARINIFRTPTVTAGPTATQAVCSTQGSIALAGTVLSTFNTGTWSASGGGAFVPTNGAVTGYSLTAGDLLAGNVIFTLTSTNNGPCAAASNTTQVQVVTQPTVLVNVTPTLCSSSPTAVISATILGSGNVMWNTSGNGTFPAGTGVLNGNYVAGTNDINLGSVTLSLSSINQAPCASAQASANVVIQAAPQATAGANQLICSIQQTVSLNGLVTGVTNSGTWTASGAGQFSPSNTTTTTYSLTQADILAGAVAFTLGSANNGVCPQATSSLTVQVTRQPTVIASPSQSICSSNPSTAISGTVLGGSGSGTWTTNGSGTFSSGGSLNTSYVISSNDITSGSVLLTLSSANSSPCPVPLDTLRLYIQIPPQVNADSNQLICSNQQIVPLTGTVLSSFNTGTWSTNGSGAFTPTNAAVTTYSTTQADINAGIVIFTLTSTSNGGCNAASATMSVQISRESTVVASSHQTLCSTSGSASINGTITGSSSSGLWSTSGTGSFVNANSTVSNAYVFTAGDVSTGTVTLVLSSTNNSPCPVVSDSLIIHVQSPSIVNTGTYGVVCSGSGTFGLSGTVTGGKGTGVWTSAGGGTVTPSGDDLNGSYALSANEILYGVVNLTLTSTNNGACLPNAQTVSVQVVQQASVLAAPDVTVCSNIPQVALTGTLSGSFLGSTWSTAGSGSITAPNALTTNYILSADEITAQAATVILSTPPNGPCPADEDTTYITITKRPEITLKSDTSVCSKQNPVVLNSEIADGSGTVLWVTSGTGTFIPNNFLANASYMMSAADISTGTVQLSVNSLSNGACGNVSSSMRINILPSPVAAFSTPSLIVTIPSTPVIFTNETVGGNTFSWEVSDGLTANTLDLTKQFTSVGYYTVTLAAESKDGCQDTTFKVMTVISSVKFPTAFTPNGDRLNDQFRLYTDGVVEFELMIFNRWGEMIFRSDRLDQGWDGTFKGKTCQQDVYVWKAAIKFFDGRKFEDKGSITLIK